MELVASQLYGDKSHTEFNVMLSPGHQKQLLLNTREYFLGLGVEGAECEIERISGRGLFNVLPNKALFVYAELGESAFQAAVTVNRFGPHCVVGLYKLFLSEDPFALNHSQEIRRRAVIDALTAPYLVDHFFLLDQAVEVAWEFARQSVFRQAEASNPSHSERAVPELLE